MRFVRKARDFLCERADLIVDSGEKVEGLVLGPHVGARMRIDADYRGPLQTIAHGMQLGNFLNVADEPESVWHRHEHGAHRQAQTCW